jgi:hypothetical protein
VAPDTCTWDTIDRPVTVWPTWDEVINTLNPTFTWTYADPDCPVAYYNVKVMHNYDVHIFGESAGWTFQSADTNLTWPDTLEPASSYYWYMWPVVNTASGLVEGPPNEAFMPFSTGPECGRGEELLAPELMMPEDGSTAVTRADGFGFYWDDPTMCIPGPYTLEISEDEAFTAPYIFPGETRADVGVYSDPYFTWQDCHRYWWRVRAQSGIDSYGPYSNVFSFVANLSETACEGPTPVGPTPVEPLIECPTPVGPTPPGPTPVGPLLHANMNSACRSGPGLDYPVLAWIEEGNEWFVGGMNADASWWLIQYDAGTQCWVSNTVVTVTGDLCGLPVVEVEPPPANGPTPLPVRCGDFNNENACEAHPECKWYRPPTWNNEICGHK